LFKKNAGFYVLVFCGMRERVIIGGVQKDAAVQCCMDPTTHLGMAI
jgi:hypothetical protein